MPNLFSFFRSKKSKQKTNGSVPGTSDNNVLIDLRHVVKTFETPAGPFTALKDINLQVEAGEFVAVIGKSGSGKSTLINMVTGIDRPTLGEVYMAGTGIHNFNETQMARWRGKTLGIIFQFFQLLPTLSLIENVMLPMELVGQYTPRERRERGEYLLELVDLGDQIHKLPAMVSGGQQQRAAIARSLANDPPILVADEPTGNLDTKTSDVIFQLFEDFVAKGRTILMVTHDRDLASRVTRVVLIADGDIADQPIIHALPSLDKQQLVQISTKLIPINYQPGSIVFHEGDVANQFYIIIKGEIDIVKQHHSGQEVILAVLGSGQYFGEIGLMENSPRNATARAAATSEVVLMGLDRDMFAQLMTDSDLTHSSIARLMRQRTTVNHLLEALLPVDEVQPAQRDIEHKLLTFKPGETIFQKGDVADKFYIIMQGEVDVMHPYHQDVPIAQLTSGQYFGEGGLQQRRKRANTVRADPDSTTGVKVIAIAEETFHQLISGDKLFEEEIALTMRHYLSEQLGEFMPNLHRRARKGVLDKLDF